MESVTPEINLLPLEDLERAPLGKFLKWALTAGRYIVIITELIVLLAFLSRFKLDRDISDLSDDISRKKSIIAATASFENRVRRLQVRLKAIDDLGQSAPAPEKYLPFIASVLPQEAVVNRISIDQRGISLFGFVGSEGGIATLTQDLRKNSQVKDVSVEKVEQSPDGSNILSFVVSVTLWH